jgi:hypothetical protein
MTIEGGAAVELMREIIRLDARIDQLIDVTNQRHDQTKASIKDLRRNVNRPYDLLWFFFVFSLCAMLFVLVASFCWIVVGSLGAPVNPYTQPGQRSQPGDALEEEVAVSKPQALFTLFNGQFYFAAISHPEHPKDRQPSDGRQEHQDTELVKDLSLVLIWVCAGDLERKCTNSQRDRQCRQRQWLNHSRRFMRYGQYASNGQYTANYRQADRPDCQCHDHCVELARHVFIGHDSLSFSEGIVQVIAGACDARDGRQFNRLSGGGNHS